MVRVRLTFSKRGRACFVPHIALPTVFARSAARAGISFELSEGFTPRPRISLGPELPVGVPALAEPLEARLLSCDGDTPRRWDTFLPPGFAITGWKALEGTPGTEEVKSLGKLCNSWSCLLALRRNSAPPLEPFLQNLKEQGVILDFAEAPDRGKGFFRSVLENPSQRGPGLLVKALTERALASGWPDVFIVREKVGALIFDPSGRPDVLPPVPPFERMNDEEGPR